MDSAYRQEVERILAMLEVAIKSANRPDADRVAREVDRYVRSYLTPSGGRGEGR